jgi:hypothetical protein
MGDAAKRAQKHAIYLGVRGALGVARSEGFEPPPFDP